jgi:hypothetical protein
MNGSTLVSSASLFTGPDWVVTATRDLDGNSKADLIWYNPSAGETGIWLMNGTSLGSDAGLITDPNWWVPGP